MAGVDLNLYTFDYDLTFAVLVMNGDGTIYHRYGTRDHGPATARLSMASLVRLLKDTLEDHAEYQKRPDPPPPRPKRSIEDIPTMTRKIEERKQPECFHCHMVNDEERSLAREEKRYLRAAVIGMWPLPDRLGLKLGRDDQVLVEEVVPGSPAERAGIRPRDRILDLGKSRVRTQMDIQWELEHAGEGPAEIPVAFARGSGEVLKRSMALEKGWKLADPLSFSWRASMWQLRPRPGFGGRALKGKDLERLKLDPGAWAVKVDYLVDWGDEAYTGQSARKAGLKKGDVVLAAGGKRDFASELHFQSWFRFTQRPGSTIELEVLRDGKRLKLALPVLE